jgi:predicted Rossmann-fold nucleotide-binding protein
VGGFGTTEEIETWMAQGTGPVKSEVFLLAGGHNKLTTTEELLSFTKG